MPNNDVTASQASQAGKATAGQGAGAPAPVPANEFEAVKARLEEIMHAVEDDELPLDDALDLYEEAVKLGLQASSLLESAIEVEDEPADELPGETPAGAPAGSVASTGPDSATPAVSAAPAASSK